MGVMRSEIVDKSGELSTGLLSHCGMIRWPSVALVRMIIGIKSDVNCQFVTNIVTL